MTTKKQGNKTLHILQKTNTENLPKLTKTKSWFGMPFMTSSQEMGWSLILTAPKPTRVPPCCMGIIINEFIMKINEK